jgi:hypothetical protein
LCSNLRQIQTYLFSRFYVQIDQFEKTVTTRLEMMAASINVIESNIAAVLAHHETIAAESEMRALELVDKERGEKKVLCQWLNGFLAASSHQLRLDPIDFAFARFSLNMAVGIYMFNSFFFLFQYRGICASHKFLIYIYSHYSLS